MHGLAQVSDEGVQVGVRQGVGPNPGICCSGQLRTARGSRTIARSPLSVR